MTSPVRVCLVSPMPPPYGGIARWTHMVHRQAQRRSDLELSVINIALRWRSIHETSWSRRVLAGGHQLVRSCWALSRMAARARPDVVHVNTSGQLGVIRDLSLLLIARISRVPFVYHIRFGLIPRIAARNTPDWRVMTWVMRRSAAVITLDKLTEATIGGHLPGVRLTRIPNCVDLTELPLPTSAAPSAKTVLFVGWVVPTKGIEELLDAWSQLGADRSGWSLQVAGSYDRTYVDSLHARIDPLESVEFLGELPHATVLELMATCEIFVLPSHSEGFPNAVLEAMALGRAIVSTNVGAVGEMLADGCGVVVAPSRVDDLANGLTTLMHDARLRQELGDRARARALAHYSLSAVMDRYVELWCRVARPASPGSATTRPASSSAKSRRSGG